MRYHIDTIPIWDALRLKKGCLFCALHEKTENTLTDRYLGASVMEPATRIRVNDRGFCQKHQNMLFKQENKLGHALLMQSHLSEINKKLENAFNDAHNNQKKGIFFKNTQSANDSFLEFTDSCIICDDLDDNMQRYCYSILHLYKTDESFKKEFLFSRGLCLPHVRLVINMAEKHYPAKLYKQICEELKQQTLEQLKVIKEDIDWFTQKFDYRNQDAPWKNSRDALERCINFLSGKTIGEAFWGKEK
ncbi:MAG: DUF6062 family protein [Eubacteriales bacterium]|nr:DUF6062 family protein [Eubacteriales bacterium]